MQGLVAEETLKRYEAALAELNEAERTAVMLRIDFRTRSRKSPG
jgi:DNA-directed RNA polymerase specialized sigma24 family protein